MTLSQLINVLSKVRGNAHEAVLELPNGKRYEATKVVSTSELDVGGNEILKTVVVLKEVK